MSDEVVVVLISHGHNFVAADAVYEVYADEFIDMPDDARGCKMVQVYQVRIHHVLAQS